MSDAPKTTSDVIRLPNVRLSFAKLFKPRAFAEGQEPRYEGSFLLDPSDEAHQAVIDEICEKALGVIKAKHNGKVPKGIDMCFGYSDGDAVTVGPNEYRNKPKEYDGYEGMFYISSSNKEPPKLVGRTKDKNGKFTPVEEKDNLLYSGAYVNATITLWAQDNDYGKRVNANLRAVQFVNHGEAFGVAPVDAEDEFDEVEVEEDAGWDDVE
jgi:hypothetical protein